MTQPNPQQDSEYQQPQYTSRKVAELEVEKAGIPPVPKPAVEYPFLTGDISSLDDTSLTMEMGRIKAWMGYVGTELAKAEIDALIADAVYKEHIIINKLQNLGASAGNDKTTIATDKAKVLDSSQDLHRDVLVMEAKSKLMTARYNELDGYYNVLSRELTRRGYGEHSGQRR